jgi:predicted metal-dependent HD superfamily phosphohydrolase
MFFAIVMHDAIWVPGESPQSEDMSMKLVPYVYHQVTGQKIPVAVHQETANLIRWWTIVAVHTTDMREKFGPNCGEARRILDLDLSSMCLDWKPFVEIQVAIDKEFEHTGTPRQRMIASANFLSLFVRKGFVYYTEEMQHMNAKAIRNLKAYITCVRDYDMATWKEILEANPIELEKEYTE